MAITLSPALTIPKREALDDFESQAKRAGNFIVGRRTFEASFQITRAATDIRIRDQLSFCRTLIRISSENCESCTARASTTPPIIAAV